MIEFEKAISIINSITVERQSERIPLLQAIYRILARDVKSDMDMPPFDKAAMDGYACRYADLNKELTVVDEIPAGKFPDFRISEGQCARIMTGAPLPEGADMVVMQEYVVKTGPKTIKAVHKSGGSNICYAGEDVKSGGIILEKGTRIRPHHIAMLASAGCVYPEVNTLPLVAILSTGDELVHPSVKPEKGKIRNSNGYQLASQLIEQGISATDLGIIGDDRKRISESLGNAIEKFDLILVSGGVSVGDYDYIPSVLEELNVDTIFRGLKIKPGKHILVGRKKDHFVAALPGNPVSAFVLFETIIKILLSRLTGAIHEVARYQLPLESDFETRNKELLCFVPVKITADSTVLPAEYHGSAHIHAYRSADGIMEIPAGAGRLSKGEKVYVRPI